MIDFVFNGFIWKMKPFWIIFLVLESENSLVSKSVTLSGVVAFYFYLFGIVTYSSSQSDCQSHFGSDIQSMLTCLLLKLQQTHFLLLFYFIVTTDDFALLWSTSFHGPPRTQLVTHIVVITTETHFPPLNCVHILCLVSVNVQLMLMNIDQ